MALDSWLYGDPERVLERKQAQAAREQRACGDCQHHITLELRGETLHGCDCKRRQYGRRCDLYQPNQPERK